MGPRAPRKRTIEDVNSDSHKFLQSYYEKRGIPQSPTDDANLLSDCVGRAEDAREDFKRWRAGTGEGAFPPGSQITANGGEDGSGSASGSASGEMMGMMPGGSGRPRDSIPPGMADAIPPLHYNESEMGNFAGSNAPKLSPKEKYLKRLANNRKSADAARVYQEVLRREHSHALREVTLERDTLSFKVADVEERLMNLKEENSYLKKCLTEAGVSTDEFYENTDDKGTESEEGGVRVLQDSEAQAAARLLHMLGSQPREVQQNAGREKAVRRSKDESDAALAVAVPVLVVTAGEERIIADGRYPSHERNQSSQEADFRNYVSATDNNPNNPYLPSADQTPEYSPMTIPSSQPEGYSENQSLDGVAAVSDMMHGGSQQLPSSQPFASRSRGASPQTAR